MAKKKKPTPTNPKLYAACKAKVKKSYKVWPSAYSSGALVKCYRKKGGSYR